MSKAPNFIDLHYEVQRNEQNFFFTLRSQDEDRLANIDQTLAESLESFGITLEEIQDPYTFTAKLKDRLVYKLPAKLEELLNTIWKIEYGFPRFYFSGDVKLLPEAYKGRSVIVSWMSSETTNDSEYRKKHTDACELLLTALAFTPKMAFSTQRFSTTDHKAAVNFLRQSIYEDKIAADQAARFNFDLRMSTWYPDETERKTLSEAAHTEIAKFLVAKKLDLYVPTFLVVPTYHIRRYQKAFDLITEKYHPNFIFTLPISVNNQIYTVLFPVIHSLKKKKD